MTIANGFMYAAGGYDNANVTRSVYYAPINANGTLGAWQTNANSFIVTREYNGLEALNGYLYAIADSLHPGSFAFAGSAGSFRVGELLYFSFTVLTSTGFGDVVPVQRVARALCVLEQLTGALFLAILIARLAGVYPPRREDAGV